MRKLILLDADSTLFNEEVIDLLSAKAGREKEVSEITALAMNGDLDFESSLRSRVALLDGLPEKVLDQVQRQISLTTGAMELISYAKKHDHLVAVVSGGFTQVLAPICEGIGIDLFIANNLEIVNERLTGNLLGPVIDRAAKARALIDFANSHDIPIEQTIAIGDGANDIDMIKEAGLGIAFCAKRALNEVADIQISERNLYLVTNYL